MKHLSLTTLILAAALLPRIGRAETPTPTPTATSFSQIQSYVDTAVPSVRLTAVATYAAVETPIPDIKGYAITATELESNYTRKCPSKVRKIPCLNCYDLAAISMRERLGKNGGIFVEALKILRAEQKNVCGKLK